MASGLSASESNLTCLTLAKHQLSLPHRYDWGHGEAELAVVCQVDDPPEETVCENLSGFQYNDGAASCYLASWDQAADASDDSGRRMEEAPHPRTRRGADAEAGDGSDALEEEVHELRVEVTEMKAMIAQLLERAQR